MLKMLEELPHPLKTKVLAYAGKSEESLWNVKYMYMKYYWQVHLD